MYLKGVGMHVELVDHTDNPEEVIGKFAAICYDSATDTEACLRRAKSCVHRGHLATLRFAYATFKVEGISRACSHQLVRSKHLDYLQESQRYVEHDNVEVVLPSSLTIDDSMVYDEAMKHAIHYYKLLRKLGIKKEDARYVLPNAATTSLYVTGNFQAWLDFIRLRKDSAAQWEIKQVAIEIEQQLNLIAPNIFKKDELKLI